jgi:uncharacterized protein (TIGR02996 family)
MNAAFLAAIRAAPADDQLRLVYADWLDEQGQGERAELIRLQIELPRLGVADARRPDLLRREAELLADHRADWLREELPPGVFVEEWSSAYQFRRGLPVQVTCPFSAFVSVGEDLAAEDRLAGLVELHLHLNPLGPEGARALAGSSRLAGLEELNLYSTGLDDDAAFALAASAHLRPTWLFVGHNAIGPAGARALAESPLLERIVKLVLHENPLGDEGVRALAGAGWLGRLHELDLHRTRFGDAGASALAESPGAARLRRLRLDDNRIGDEGALALARSRHLGRLHHLDLSGNPLGERGLEALRERFGACLVFRSKEDEE